MKRTTDEVEAAAPAPSDPVAPRVWLRWLAGWLPSESRARRALARSARDLVENAVEGIFLTTPGGRYLSANQALARIYGYDSPAELMRAVTDVTAQLYLEPRRREDFVRALREHGSVTDFESRVIRRDGSVIWISENARAVHDRSGRLLHYEGMVVDVTRRKEAEEAWRESESELRRHRELLEDLVEERTVKLRRANEGLEREMAERQRAEAALRLRDLAIGSVSEGVCITDPGKPWNPIVWVNEGFERLTGYSRDEVVGRSCALLQGPDSDPLVIARIRDALREARECQVELLNYRKNGTTFWNLVSITPVRDESGRLAAFIGVQFDITERRRVEALQRDLLATVSHELRTPLSSLRGFTELLLEREYPAEKRREFLGIVHAETLRLMRLVNDFLDLQRMESGNQAYRLGAVDLGALLREAAVAFGPGGGRTIRLDLAAGLGPVRADPDRIRQVVANLLSNAVKFSPAGGEVVLGARPLGAGAELRVEDAGIGIRPEDRPLLFRRFGRLPGEQARAIGGAGLGLAIVKEIVESHGGRVGVEPREGGGSRFTVWLPAARVEYPRDEGGFCTGGDL